MVECKYQSTLDGRTLLQKHWFGTVLVRFLQLPQWERLCFPGRVCMYASVYARSTTCACQMLRLFPLELTWYLASDQITRSPSRSAPGSVVSHCSAAAKHLGRVSHIFFFKTKTRCMKWLSSGHTARVGISLQLLYFIYTFFFFKSAWDNWTPGCSFV